jgi:sugar phosphate isomerase/epimerase
MAPDNSPAGLHVSIRDAMVREAIAPGASLYDGMQTLGVKAVELDLLSIGDKAPFSVPDDSLIRNLRDLLVDSDMRVSALLLGTNFATPDAEQHVDWTLRAIEVAEKLGAPAVRIDATYWGDMPVETIRDRCIDCISRILNQSAASRVDLAIENHGKISNEPKYLDAIFEAVPNPRLGLTLDIGNFYWYGYPLEELYGVIEHFAPRARHTHIKSIDYPPELARQRRAAGFEYGKYASPLDEGNLDLQRIVGLLHAAGYRRGLCIENEALGKYPADQRMQILHRDVAAVNDAISKIGMA